jgi:hypothetical protein
VRLRRTAVLIASVGVVASAGTGGANAERGAVRQPTYANLVGPGVARAGSVVTLRGSVGIWGSSGHVPSGYVVVESRSAGTANWKTLTSLGLRSDGTFVFKTRLGTAGARGVRDVVFRVVFAGDATHGPSSHDYTTEVVMPSTRPQPAAPATLTAPPGSAPVSIQIKPDAFVEPQVGGWTASGATNDLGRYLRIPPSTTQNACFCLTTPESFEEDFVLTNSPGTGTLTIRAQETETPTTGVPMNQGGPWVQSGVWVITSATGIYNGVTGSGTDEWMAGTLTLALTGMMTKVG